MKEYFASTNYAEAYLSSGAVTAANNLPPVAMYRASLIQALSWFKVYFKDDPRLDEAIKDINNKNYTAAESIIRTKLQENANSQTDVELVIFAGIQKLVEQAEKARKTPGYSEAETQNVFFRVSLGDIPIAFFP